MPGGGTYLAVHLVRGVNLWQKMEAGPLPWVQVCQIGPHVTDGLAAAHTAGIVHRDLKPKNILLEPRPDGSMHV
ncbi:hypothetical protein OV203_47515 [Nannocystis sp. ILAH1]|uniref:protein kinase domain-containing protein n=1 Tax=Nannocystis sp. RBIL2 TaxID=2996788 RepID=UPI0022710395|nr:MULTISPECIES: hypothetical protein [unclassified Nannocystis]MCY0994868.1 hypothetical protein [Nannocystis sp. ILAH1]MCY1065302.1 hypothetical protein [Nannocystis sp. RBIL2]